MRACWPGLPRWAECRLCSEAGCSGQMPAWLWCMPGDNDFPQGDGDAWELGAQEGAERGRRDMPSQWQVTLMPLSWLLSHMSAQGLVSARPALGRNETALPPMASSIKSSVLSILVRAWWRRWMLACGC